MPLPIDSLIDQYRHDLFEDFLPFMERYVIDHEQGGFLCHTDRRGRNLSGVKNSWYEGRGIWVYSFLYNHIDPRESYLETARKSVEFILRLEPEKPGTCWPRQISRDGTPLSEPCEDVYGDLFIAEGLAEYSEAVGDCSFRDKALRILHKCVEIYDRSDYLPDIGQTYLGPGAPPFPGARILGHWMVLIRLCTQLLRQQPDSRIESLADRCMDAILNHHHNPDFGLLNELIDHDLSRPRNEYAQLVYTGHALETLWMVFDEAVRRGDTDLQEKVAERFLRHYRVARDDVFGGVFRNLQHVEKNLWSLDKVLWAQEEVLIGSLLIYETLGKQWALDIFLEMNDYVQDHYPLKNRGLPLWIFFADRKVTFREESNRIENFHHPRHLMLNLLALSRLKKRTP